MVELPNFVERKTTIENAIYSGIGQRNTEEQVPMPPGVIRLSSIGQCQRRLWARLHDVKETRGFSNRILAVFRLGHVIEDLLVQHLVDAGFPVTDQQKQVKMNLAGGSLRGHIDGVVTVRGVKHLLEIKSSNERRFDNLCEIGYEKWSPDYSGQLQTYMAGLKLKAALVVVYNKNDSRIYVEKIPFDAQAYDELIDKAERVFRSEDTPPDRPAEARNKSCDFCRWCGHSVWCWGSTSDVKFDE